MTFELFLTEPHFRQVLATALIVAATSAALGVLLVLRGLSLFGDGVAHISFAGVALGFVLGWLPLATALAASIAGALAIHALQSRGVLRGDAAIGVVFTASLAFGVVLVSRQRGIPVDIEAYLFGNVLLASREDLLLVLVLAVLVLGFMAALFRPLFLLTFDEEAAYVQGLPVRFLSTVTTLATAATVVLAVRVVGVLLVSSLLIIPAATALQFARGFRQTILGAVGLSVAAVLLGLFISAEADLASGATIALVSAGFFIVALVLRRIL